MNFCTHEIRLLFCGALAQLVCAVCAADAVSQTDYQWQNVSIGGGGAVTGIVLHPKIPDLAYVRTDVGGAYRWESSMQSWIPLLDHIPAAEWNLYGVDSIAIDPGDITGNTLYLSTGKYVADWASPAGMLMKSSDRGRTWTRLPLSPTGGSNQDQAFGERLAVDPANASHVFYAARSGTLFESRDAGATWRTSTTIPQKTGKPENRGNGLSFVIFDPSSGTATGRAGTRTLYVGASGHGVFCSDDSGASWNPVANAPARPIRAAIGGDGILVVSHSAGLALLDHKGWRDISPPAKDKNNQQCGAVSIDSADSRCILASRGGGHGMQVWFTRDSGQNWTLVNGRRNQTRTWWPQWHWFSAISSLALDPNRPGKAWATDWYGVYTTPDVTAAAPIWTNQVTGIEEIVTTGPLLAPRDGPVRLFSCIADIGGLDHLSLSDPPAAGIWSRGLPAGLTRTGVAISSARPGLVVTVGVHEWNKPGTGGYSLDGGSTWIPFKTKPFAEIKGGRVLLADSGKRILWAPQRSRIFYSDDLGNTWQRSLGLEKVSHIAEGDGVFVYDQPVAVDSNDSRVYAFTQGKLFVSIDAGRTFALLNDQLPDYWKRKLVASDIPGDLWLALGGNGLHHSADGGRSFHKITSVDHAELFCTGPSVPGSSAPMIFMMGKVSGRSGFFRSDDLGDSWRQIDNPSQRIGNDPNVLASDPRTLGAVFIGTNGRGIFYGQPASR